MDAAQKVLKNEPDETNVRFHGHDRLCHCQLKGGDATEARRACSEALKARPEEPRILCDRAEAYLAEDMYDEVGSINIQYTRHLLSVVEVYALCMLCFRHQLHPLSSRFVGRVRLP